jgi:undecaprenyl diphosphate synthase
VLLGHEQAVNKVFEPLIDQAILRGVKYLTFWIFSTENWQRDKREVEGLMNLFRSFFDRQLEELHQKGVRFKMIGNLSHFPPDIQQKITENTAKTKDNKAITVTLAMSYGGRDEITRAVQKISEQVAAGELQPSEVSEELISNHLDTVDIPDPEIIVRTSGEQRLSGFLAWQMNYAEFYFPEFAFPEFTPERLDEVIAEFEKRGRRFGK